MITYNIKSVGDYLETLRSKRVFPEATILFRGQNEDLPLLPKLCRNSAEIDNTNVEKEMLIELKRRSKLLVSENLKDDWDWIVYAQHYGLATRLLDWTTNPLVALWFAIQNSDFEDTSFVYRFYTKPDDFLSEEERKKGLYRLGKTKVLNPTLNNKRIVAQHGWFTAHLYSNSKTRFLPLEENTNIKSRLVKFEVFSDYKLTLIDELNILGVNNQSMFPDVVGLCQQINWEFSREY